MDHVAAAILRLMPTWRAEHIERITYLTGGYANDNYRFEYGGDTFVIRIVRGPRDTTRRRVVLLAIADRAGCGRGGTDCGAI